MKDPVKEKIQELCPDVMEANCEEGEMHYCSTHRGYIPPVLTLAVVLRAIQTAKIKLPDIHLTLSNGLCLQTGKDFYWNLEHDNYDAQSEETKRYIGELLTKE